MTNAEKYLKPDMKVAMWKDYNETGQCKSIWQWLDQEAKPTLTEDERVILRNIKKEYITILRNKAGDLGITTERDENGVRGYNDLEFNRSLFKFIKERRRILY